MGSEARFCEGHEAVDEDDGGWEDAFGADAGVDFSVVVGDHGVVAVFEVFDGFE